MQSLSRKIYYTLKPFIPRSLQLDIRRRIVRRQVKTYSDIWPIDSRAGRLPDDWHGWPDGKRFALVLTHDVDTARGHERCGELAGIEDLYGFRSSFNFVPQRYTVSQDLRHYLDHRGFEIGVHGLNHDGRYFSSHDEFRRRAQLINEYLKEWNSVGYRSPSMMRNLEWFHYLNITYDASTFDTDPFEPQPEAVQTIFPFIVRSGNGRGGYVELPYTLPQDFTLFILMREQGIDIWKRKLRWICDTGGMALINVHPDYMNFTGNELGPEEYPAKRYVDFLDHIQSEYQGLYWHALPRDVASWYYSQSKRH